VKYSDLAGKAPGESSEAIRQRVGRARKLQQERFTSEKIFANAQMTPRLIRKFCEIDGESQRHLEYAMTKMGLSARAYDRILKVSRTIADMEDASSILSRHISEAIQYRSLDRTYWA
jgi:magnesium chelatase family protein